ncbi:hypothetical protein [Salinarimonas sp.]|uniref:hypothetical protein n=1 Tax=Salinarimonas sp. TaxID=2766526 RepID=UPI0032D8DCC6
MGDAINGTAARTVKAALQSLFPYVDGQLPYMSFPDRKGRPPRAYVTPPMLPPDVFAASAYLLELSGAYHHVVSERTGAGPMRQIQVDAAMRDEAGKVAAAWRAFEPKTNYKADDPKVFGRWLRGAGAPLTRLYAWWDAVFEACADEPVFRTLSYGSPPPDWWSPALSLFIAADEAALEYGWRVPETKDGEQPSWLERLFASNYGAQLRQPAETTTDESGLVRGPDSGVVTLSSANQDVATVLPKARTAAVGCTLRSLSHHLALLPARGIARGAWFPFLFESPPALEQQMNILLVPFPFSIEGSAFRPAADYMNGRSRFGYFELAQTWLGNSMQNALAHFTENLIHAAKNECSNIHGVIFPELALDSDTYQRLRDVLIKRLPEIEFLIAGVSESEDDNGEIRSGNFVSMTLFQDKSGQSKHPGLLTQREKHHRWRLDRYQILEYGLEGFLDPSCLWWENIDLLSRRVDFAVVRPGTVISAMICEDLARVDPCQELLRAVGPNIVFALLMDAPQLRARWPARYATVLAEDPGSAVLTLTSRALMTRQHRTSRRLSTNGSDRVVALWRDDAGAPIEIACPYGAHAVRLTLSAVRVSDVTLDGREDDRAVAWRYENHAPVCLPDPGAFGGVLGAEDVACRP